MEFNLYSDRTLTPTEKNRGVENENKSQLLCIYIQDRTLFDKNAFIEFKTDDEETYITERLEISEDGEIVYQLLNGLMQTEYLQFQVIFTDDYNWVWKSVVKQILIQGSINTADKLAKEYPDFISNAQEVLSQVEQVAETIVERVDAVEETVNEFTQRVEQVEQTVEEYTQAEESRVQAENLRVANETQRIANENERVSNEQTRVSNETARQVQETTRQGNEQTRQANEEIREQNENTRKSNEISRQSAEQTRVSQETTRQSNEAARVTNEGARVQAEAERAAEFATWGSQLNQIAINTSNISSLQIAVNGKQDKFTIESFTIQSSSWTTDNNIAPFTVKANITISQTLSANTIVELINDDAISFATYGFSIGAINGQVATIYALEAPTANVGLKIKVED